MATNYLILKTEPSNGICYLTAINNVPHPNRLKAGTSYKEEFPDDACFKMNPDFPKNIRLADSLQNNSSALVVSERFKTILEDLPGALFQNEILPVKIINHRGRTEKAPYFIIHQLNQPACLDEKKTKGTRSTLEPQRFQFMKKMVLDEDLIPSQLMLFRPAQFRRYPLVRRDLAESLAKFNLTGFEFCEIAGFEFGI